MRLPRALVVLCTLLPVAGCSCGESGSVGSDGDGGSLPDGARPADAAPDVPTAPPIPGLRALRVEPAETTVEDDGVAPGETATLRAFGTFGDGEREVTDEVAWSLLDARLGDIDAGRFTSAGIGGRTQVVAAAGGTSATAELSVVLDLVVTDPALPPGTEAMFPDDTSGDSTEGGPRILYPSHETMLPRNLAPVNHQWAAQDGLDLFELRLEGESARIRLVTRARSLQPEADVWSTITESFAGGSATMTVRALSTASPARVLTSAPHAILFSRSEVLGALYYWSTGAQGVVRGHISAAVASKFYTDPTSGDDTCVACHTVSRDGRRLAVGYDGERLREVTIPEREVLIPSGSTERGPEYGWGTFNPGATRLLYASRGALRLLDADTGDTVADVALPEGGAATHPDWSPDGRFVALAYVAPGADGRPAGRVGNKDVQASSLARLPVMPDGTFGEPEVLLESTGPEDTIFFPSYSPDSRWIAFVRATGKSKDNATSALYLLRADGTGEPILVTRSNERVGDQDGVTGIGNTMPTWAPSTTPEIFWLAFSSLRDYGAILVGTERDQLWAAAIDPAAIERGEDPGYAAFWLPFQDVQEGNHRAFWALATEDACPSTVEICDELDNDCDGIVDEMCCVPAAEVCDNGVDDDCDGEADEGCGCLEIEENCTNGLDDDCDLLTDDADEDCIII
ncbi:MAG: PD40 domain-containing protein [Deltaproteobacteria bacterium]|nr:PD40 domain-containing protein [Deltaproteobacteria bacterium]